MSESTEPFTNSVSQQANFDQLGQNITGTKIIALTEPGSSIVSDTVTATIRAGSIATEFTLTVLLTSDNETLLASVSADLTIPETGAVQDLTTDFENLFDLNTTNPLPGVLVQSEIEAVPVPEPTSLAILATGLAGLVFVRRRKV